MTEEKLLVKREGEFNYPIYFEKDFSYLAEAVKKEGFAGCKMCIVADSNVAPLYASSVKEELQKISDLQFPSGSLTESDTSFFLIRFQGKDQIQC